MSSGADLVRSFGVGVRRLREAHGWSQERLAEHASLNRSYIGEVERGQVTVSLATVAKLARAFKLAPSALLSHVEPAGNPRGQKIGGDRRLSLE